MQHSVQGYVPPPIEERYPQSSGNSMFLLLLLTFCLVLAQGFVYFAFGLQAIVDHLPFFLALNFALAVLYCVIQPSMLLIAAVCLLPFTRSGLAMELGGITFTPYNLGMILLSFLAISRKLLLNRPIYVNWHDLFLALVCASFFVSTLYAKDVRESGFLAFHSIFIPVLSLFVCRIMLDTEEKYSLLIRCLLICMVPFGLLTIWEFLASGRRGYAPIGTGTMLLIPIAYMASTKYFPLLVRVGVLFICAAAMVLTFSRVLTIVLVVSPLFYLAIRRGRAVLLFAVFFVFTFAITTGLAGLTDELKPDRYFTGEDKVQISSERITNPDHWRYTLYNRAVAFEGGLQSFMDNPIFGQGLYASFGGTTQHNFNIEWLEYGGVVGYVLFLAFFMGHVVRAAPYTARDPVLQTNLTLLLGVLSNALFNGIMHGFIALVVFLVVGLSEARVVMHKNNERDGLAPSPA